MLSDYGIMAGNTLHLVLRLSGGVELFNKFFGKNEDAEDALI